MTVAQAQRLICNAALLEDAEAAECLYQQLSLCTEYTEGVRELLLAFAWLAPQEALSWYEKNISAMPDLGLAKGWVEQLEEAHQLAKQGSDTFRAYSTMTALFANSPEQQQRLRIQWLCMAMSTPERILEDPGWYRQLTNPFLRARMWKWFPKRFWEGLKEHPMLVRGSQPVGQLMLAALGRDSNLPLLFELTLSRSAFAQGPYQELEVFGLLAALDTLEEYHPRELKNAAPTLFQTLNGGWGLWDAVLLAPACSYRPARSG